MINLGGHINLGWVEGVAVGELDIQKEGAAFEWSLCGALNGSTPFCDVVLVHGGRGNSGNRFLFKVFKFFTKSICKWMRICLGEWFLVVLERDIFFVFQRLDDFGWTTGKRDLLDFFIFRHFFRVIHRHGV